MKQIKLQITDNIFSKVLVGEKIVSDIISYEATYWIKTRFRKQKKTYQKTLVKKFKDGIYIYNGWIERIKTYCEENNIHFEITGEIERLEPTNKPCIPGITFRDYQVEFIDEAVKRQHGVLVAPPGSGKSLTSLGIISCFKNSKSLFLAPTKDLMYQAANTFKSKGYFVSLVGDGNKDISGDIVCSTIQSAKNLDFDEIGLLFDILILDECHLAVKNGATVEKILSGILSPLKIGVTATPPSEIERGLILEGLTGKIIKEIDFKEAKEAGIVTNVMVEFVSVPQLKSLNKYTKYSDIRKYGIVKNGVRNNLIVKKVKEYVENGDSCIVFCVEIEHIKILSELLGSVNIKHEVVHGKTSSDNREEVKNKIFKKDILCVISSVIWCQGLDISTLNGVVLAGGGKSSERLIQVVGRGMRTSRGKEYGTVTDFKDKSKYLMDHCEARIKVYKEIGWLK